MMGARIVPLLFCWLPQSDLHQRAEEPRGREFAPDLLPESLASGIEVYHHSNIKIETRHRYVYDFIQANPDLFPGYFHVDLETNIRPKLRILQELGFYPASTGQYEALMSGWH